MYGLICALLIGASVVSTVVQAVSPAWLVAGFGVGTAAGIALTRIHLPARDDETGIVTASMDAIGITLLISYLVFTLLRGRILGQWIDEASVISTVSLALTAGVMLGRVIGTRRGISRLVAAAHDESPRHGGTPPAGANTDAVS